MLELAWIRALNKLIRTVKSFAQGDDPERQYQQFEWRLSHTQVQ
jgi:hypothetical protein